MLKNIFTLVVVALLFSNAPAQDSLFKTPKAEQSIDFGALGYLNSNCINNDFVSAFYYGNFLNRELRDGVSKKLEEGNLFGGMSRVGFTYTYHSLEGDNKPVFSFSIFDRSHLDMFFTRKMFNTYFYGNQMYAGERAPLGNFSLDFIRYQQFRFGWSWKGDDTHGAYGFAVSLLSGESDLSFRMPTADLYTADNGTYLDFKVAAQVDKTDPRNNKFFAQNGMGASADFFYELPYVFWNKPGKIRIDVKDLGFIRWNSKSMHYAVDSSYHYDGVTIPDIFNPPTLASGLRPDSTLGILKDGKMRQYTTALPGLMDIHTKSYYGKSIAFEKGLTWRFNTNAKLYYYAKIHFLLGRARTTDIGYVIGYGGYGRFNSGLDFTVDLGKHYSFSFMDYYLFSDVTAQSTTGLGMFVKLVAKF